MKLNETKSFLRIPVIYGIQNTKSCKWYIGSCIDMKDRFQRHRYYLRHNSHHSPKLQRAYNLYGEDSFEVHILHFLQENEDRFILEEQYIKDYDSVANGYNILDKCKHVDGFTFSMKAKEHFLEYIKTLEKSVIAIDRFSGNIDKTFESITQAAKYFNTSTSNISRVCKGNLNYIKDHVFVYTKDFEETKDYRVQNHWKGKPKSEAQKEKMRRNSKLNCPIYKYDLKNNLISEYYSISDAARQHNMSADSLRYQINKHQIVNGFLFSRVKVNKTL